MFYINNEFHASDYTHYSILLQCTLQELNDGVPHTPGRCSSDIDPLNTELNPICQAAICWHYYELTLFSMLAG